MFLLSETSRPALKPSQSPSYWAPGFFPRGKEAGVVKLTIHLNQVPRLSMSGAVPLLPLHVFMAWTGKTLLFCVLFRLVWVVNLLSLRWNQSVPPKRWYLSVKYAVTACEITPDRLDCDLLYSYFKHCHRYM